VIAIKTEKRFTTSDGTKHDSLREAKIHELTALFLPTAGDAAVTAATLCVQHDEKVIDVLTTSERSLPAARRINGGKKVRAKRGQATGIEANGHATESSPVTTTA
jgi:hypothetical protein